MPMQTIGVGTNPNDGTGDPLRSGWQKVNSNFALLYLGTDTPGVTRNLVCTNPSGKTATWSWDDLTAATSLTGDVYSSGAKSIAFNGAVTGANGMDTGATPTSADLFIYAIYNPTTATWALLGTIVGTGATIYPGANLPSGYTASALIWAGKTDGSGNFVAFKQFDRLIEIASTNAANLAATTANTYQALSISSIVPVCAKSVFGSMGPSTNNALGIAIASDSTGIGAQYFNGTPQATALDTFNGASPFGPLHLTTAQSVQWKASDNTHTARINVHAYTI